MSCPEKIKELGKITRSLRQLAKTSKIRGKEFEQKYLEFLNLLQDFRRSNDPIIRLGARLRRFSACCRYTDPPKNERELQNILYMLLRFWFDIVQREETLPRFGLRNSRPDFAIPDLRVLIEAKFISAKTNVGGVQEAILADIYGYTNPRSNFDHIVVFIYDSAHKIRDPNQFVRDLTGVKGISDVIIIPGFNS